MQGRKLLKTRWITCLAIGIIMLGGFFWTSVKGTELEEVDLSKGVTYEEEDNIINLNGNSVVITDPITDSEKSTDTNQICNIYLDTNRNGQIDNGEEPVSLDGSTDISAEIPIYGIYKQKSDTPIVITVSGKFSSDIYGMYHGELNTGDSEEIACRIDVQKGQITGCICASVYSKIETSASTAAAITISDSSSVDTVQGVYGGQIITSASNQPVVDISISDSSVDTIQGVYGEQIITDGSNQAAVDISVSDSSVKVFQGVVSGEINTKDSASKAVNISVTGNTVFQDSGSFDGILRSARIQGDVEIDIQPQTTNTIPELNGISESATVDGSVTINVQPQTTGNVTAIYGVNKGVSVNGSVTININHLTIEKEICLANAGCNITGNVSLSNGKDVYSPLYSLTYGSNVTGDASATLYGDMNNNGSGSNVQCQMIRNGIIDGNVDIVLQDGAFNGICGVQNANVKGNLDIFFEAGTYTGYVYGINGSAAVDGNVTLTSSKEAAFNSEFRGCAGSSVIGGSFMADIYGTTSSGSNTFIGVYDADVAEGIDVKLHGGSSWDYVYGINSTSSHQYTGDCRIEFENLENCFKIAGVEGASIDGKVSVIMTKCEARGVAIRGIYKSIIRSDASVTTIGCKAEDSFYGIWESTVLGDTSISMKNNICSDIYSVYGFHSVEFGGNTTIDIEGCSGYSIYGTTYQSKAVYDNCNVTISIKECAVMNIYGVSNSTPITGITDITIQDCMVTETVRGIDNTTVTKDAIVKTDNNQMKYFTGAYDCTIVGDFSVISDGDNSGNDNEGYYYHGVQGGTMVKDVIITTKDCQYYEYKGVDSAICYANAQITIDGGTYSGNPIQPYYTRNNANEKCEVDIVCKNASFTSDSSNATISNNLSAGTLTMTIEDSCTVSDAYELYPISSGSANALLTYKDDYYYAGSYPITEDINARNIYFGKRNSSYNAISANILIPEGITVTASEWIYIPNCGNVLIEGNLNGAVNQENENYQKGTIYMNGGKMEEEEQMDRRFYPLNISYLEKGGMIAPANDSISINDLRPEQYFVLMGDTPAVTCTAKKGYTLTEVTLTKDDGKPQVLTPVDDNEYSFDMEACPAELAVTFTGNQITLDKTEASLTTKLYEETTKDKPLYDMTTIKISNDGEEGDVTYEADETTELPQGLVLEDGKLFGVPTQAFEDGAKVVIQITGCNDTTTEFVLNITVMAGDEDGTPAYRVPKNLTASYGDTLGDVDLPSDENGVFTWNEEESTSVGSVGTHEFLVTYTPANKKYNVVTDIPVTVTVQKAAVEFSKIEELTAKHGEMLADLVLPETQGGEYYWVTEATVEPLDKTVYQLGFRPADADNYDWEAIEGWDEETSSVLMPVMIMIQHVYGTKWETDKENHWHVCECGEMQGKAEHTWNDGVVTKEATETEDGLKQYTCTVCEATKEEVIPAKGTTHTHVYSETWEKDEKNHWHVCECGEIQEKAEHVWNAGVVTKEATTTEDGVKQYTCTVCNETRTETVKATGNTGNTPQNPTPIDSPQNPPQTGTEISIPAAGTVLTDSVTKAKYRVTSKEGEEPAVTYLSSTNASAATLSIAANVTIDGVSYKVTAIADNAFKNNKKLKKITIGSNIITIGNNAFYGCKKLTTLTLGANVTTLGNSVFYNCTALKKVTIPKKVKKIGSKAFYNCKKLVSITIKTTKLTTKNVGSKAFTKAGSSNYKKLTVKVPKKKFKAYKTMLKKKGLSPKAKVKK